MATKKRDIFFHNVLISFSVTVMLVVLLLAASLHYSYEKILVEKICSATTEKLYQSSYSVKSMTDHVMTIASTMTSDPDISELALAQSLTPNDLVTGQLKLQQLLYSSDIIQSLYVYNKRSDTVYLSSTQATTSVYALSDFYDNEIITYLPILYNFNKLTPIPRRIKVPFPDNREAWTNVYSYFIYDVFAHSKSVDKVMVINVSAHAMGQSIEYMNYEKYPGSSTQIIDEKGKVIFSTEDNEMMHELSSEEYVKKALSQTGDKGYFTENINGKSFLVTFVRTDPKEWLYIQLTPYEYITDSLSEVKRATLIIGVLIFALGLAVIFVLSKNVSSKVDKMVVQLKNLTQNDAQRQEAKKQAFILDIINGAAMDNEEIATEFKNHNLKISSLSSIFVVLISIDKLQAFCKANNLDERNQKIVAFISDLSVKLNNQYICDIIELSDSQIIILIDSSYAEISQVSDQLTIMFKGIQEDTYTKYQFRFSAFVSNIGHTYRDIPFLYNQALELSQYRYIFGYQSILFQYMILQTQKKHDFEESNECEKELLNALLSENRDQARAAFGQLLATSGGFTALQTRMMFINLAMSIYSTVSNLLGTAQDPRDDFGQIIFEIPNVETLAETTEIFYLLFDKIIVAIGEQKKAKYDDLIQQIEAYICDNYNALDISINTIADHVNLSAAYVGRIFKQFNEISIADYIMKTRLKQAEYLLAEQHSISVNEIAEKIGFSNSSYFYIVFKKVYGITPNQYRTQHKLQTE